MRAVKLLVDVGNRRLKWASARGANGGFEQSGALDFAGADELPALAAQWAQLAPDSVWVSCVAAPPAREALARQVREAWSLDPVFIRARARQAGVVNGYAEPGALGGDRWAALVAAGAQHPRRALIVVDAGTAVTVDLLDCGVFRGGVILPGLRAMRAALTRRAEGINAGGAPDSENSPAELPDALATDTDAAVAAGAALALAGGVELALARQRASLPSARRRGCLVVATGGDAAQLAPLLGCEVAPAPDLVLRGLAVIAEAA
ncbi:MAG: type III pantothenate kinase [Gammaproteobacteria bacterium]|nr:type III pantothenate kinase [Gammaproteobacteria bacterium]